MSYSFPPMAGSSSQPPAKPARTEASALMAKRLGIKKVNSTAPKHAAPQKRKTVTPTPQSVKYDEDDKVAAAKTHAELTENEEAKPKRVRKKKGDESAEKRPRRFRQKPPVSYTERLERCGTQRMFLIDRGRVTNEDGSVEQETFDLAGSTGNVYQITVCKVPRCTCPDSRKGNQCKHIIYVMSNVLKAREDLAYQLGFLSAELAEIFANAPVTPQSSDSAASQATDTGGSRKPIDGDCPVCMMEFDKSDDDILWCKGTCGNNIHQSCFEQWAKTKSGQVRCVYCRAPWKGDEDSIKRISKSGTVNAEGYVNVGEELGLSQSRDMSSYHPYWVASQRRHGYADYEYDEH